MTMQSDVRTFVVDKLVQQAGDVSADDILTRPLSTLGLDSLDFMELLNEIEEAFSVSIEDDTVTATATVNDLIAFVEARVAARTSRSPADGS